MKSTPVLLILAMASASLFADPGSAATLSKAVGVFAHLDAEWRHVKASPGSTDDLKRYEIELQRAAEEFIGIAKSERERNPELAKAAGVISRLMVDSAFVVFSGLERKETPHNILGAHAKKIAYLPTIHLGIINALFPTDANPGGYFTQQELKDLRKTILEKFGDKISGSAAINGDNSFAQAASLTDGFLKALQK